MARASAPSMPTRRQIKAALEAVAQVHPGARIARVGPEGVNFEYPEGGAGSVALNRIDQLIEARHAKA